MTSDACEIIVTVRMPANLDRLAAVLDRFREQAETGETYARFLKDHGRLAESAHEEHIATDIRRIVAAILAAMPRRESDKPKEQPAMPTNQHSMREALQLAQRALNAAPSFGIPGMPPNLSSSYQVASIVDAALREAEPQTYECKKCDYEWTHPCTQCAPESCPRCGNFDIEEKASNPLKSP